MSQIDLQYQPWPLQCKLHECPANEILFGGAAGPGKSHALRMDALMWTQRIPGLQVYFFRRIYPELEKNHIIPALQSFPKGLGDYKESKRRWEFRNGSMLHWCHAQYEMDVLQYQGAEIHLLVIDELTTFTQFMFDYLVGRVRCTLNIPEPYRHKVPGIITGSNPGGIGHNWVKARWVIPTDRGEKMVRAPEAEGGMLRAFIPGLLDDNPSLALKDPGYAKRLDALPEPYRTAYRNGDWDLFLGQAFDFRWDLHTCEPIETIPMWAQMYMTFDWGYGKPFSVGWWWVDQDGRIYRMGEWYGSNGNPDEGLRMTDPAIAQGIIEREKQIGIWRTKKIVRIAGPDCFSKKPNYQGGGQGPATAETFSKWGIHLTKGDPDRKQKIKQFRQYLQPRNPGEVPMIQVYRTCKDFIRTIPLLQTDAKNVEDIDTTLEDHQYDEACHIMMARPLAVKAPQDPNDWLDRRIDRLKKFPVEDWERALMVANGQYEQYAREEAMLEERGLERQDLIRLEEFYRYNPAGGMPTGRTISTCRED